MDRVAIIKEAERNRQAVVAKRDDVSPCAMSDSSAPPVAASAIKPPVDANLAVAPGSFAHPTRCACGCVPNTLSLFEMAALRKKLREEKEKEKQKGS